MKRKSSNNENENFDVAIGIQRAEFEEKKNLKKPHIMNVTHI